MGVVIIVRMQSGVVWPATEYLAITSAGYEWSPFRRDAVRFSSEEGEVLVKRYAAAWTVVIGAEELAATMVKQLQLL